MIRFENVTKTFGKQTILNNISYDIPKGNVCGIIGPSGTGKSVSLRHIIGLLSPDQGNIYINNVNIAQASSKIIAEIREQIGILFQSGALLNWLSVFDNVALPLVEKTKLSSQEISQRVQEALSLVGLENMGHKMPAEISGGMKKRVGLARAIITRPKILLFDEPTSGLDPVTSRKIDHLILNINRESQATSVIVTHDLASAYSICNQIIMLYQGLVIFNGSAHDFAQSEHPVIREFINAQFAISTPQR